MIEGKTTLKRYTKEILLKFSFRCGFLEAARWFWDVSMTTNHITSCMSVRLLEHAQKQPPPPPPPSYQCEHERGVDKDTRKGREGQREGSVGSQSSRGSAGNGVMRSFTRQFRASPAVSYYISSLYCCW